MVLPGFFMMGGSYTTSELLGGKRSSRRSARKSSGSYDCKKGCTEDKKGKYTGNEPSPKGFGYCARCTPLGTKMEGKDGNMWIVKKFSKGQRWVKY